MLGLMFRFLPGHRADCEASEPTAPDQSSVEPPDPDEINETRKWWREAIHTSRNQMTISVQIGRRMQRASETALKAANEMVAEIQKNREHTN
jgi:hypothetical protein